MHQPAKRKNIVTAIIVFVIILALILCAALLVSNGKKSYPNLYVDTIPVGNRSYDKILEILNENGWQGRSANSLSVRTFCDVSVDINPVSAGVLLDSPSAAEAACSFGRDGNIISNFACYISCLFSKNDINALNSALNENYIDTQINSLQASLDSALGPDSYILDEENSELIIRKGYCSELKLDKKKLLELVANSLENGDSTLEYYTLTSEPSVPNFNALMSLACPEAENAHFSDDGSHTIVSEKNGYSFDVATTEKLWNSAPNGDIIRIPLEVHSATISAGYLESMMYHDLLGAMTTKYNNSGENRCNNVRLAASLVNGTVVFPGEEFSFNRTVGARTEDAGFLYAPAYVGYDDIQEEIGGGVCQVSTGIYASALYAFLEITAHTCHIYPPNYIQLGTDATVSIPSGGGREIDLKFRNNKSFPLKILAYCEETVDEDTGKPFRTVTVEIWGTLEDDDYMPVEFDNRYGDIYDYDRVIPPAYENREGYHLMFTHDETEFEDDTGKGLRTLTYIRVYDTSGNLLKKHIMNRKYDFGYGMDTYYYMQ